MITESIQEELAEIKSSHLFRQLKTLEPLDATRALFDGKDMTLFCGNDYLGLSQDSRLKKSAQRAIEKQGVGAGAARLISGSTSAHQELEAALALFKKKPRALVFSTGYLANLGVLSALADADDVIVMDKLCHASLIDGARLSGAKVRVFPHKNYERCREILKSENEAKRKLMVSDSVFSMDGDLADLKTLVEIKQESGCCLVIDDAHGTGVYGTEGRGAAEDEKLEEHIDVITGTLSKSLGCLGGYAAASEEMIDYFINRARPFIFATALPPALCAAILTGLGIIRQEPQLRQKLWRNAQILYEAFQADGFQLGESISPILPVILGDEEKALYLSSKLFERGFFVPAIRYPTVGKGKARLRFTVSAAHRQEDLERLIETMQDLRKDL